MLDLTQTLDGLKARASAPTATCPAAPPAVLIAAEQASGPAFRVGFNNFYVISRYNRSARYSMAVADLAQAIAAGVRAAQPQPNQ